MKHNFQTIDLFDETRLAPMPQDRLRAVRKAGHQFREQFIDQPEVVFYRSFNLIRAPYPTRYAYTGVYVQDVLKNPFLHLLTRVFVIQFYQKNLENNQKILKTLLFSPSDYGRNAETPFFKTLTAVIPSEKLQNIFAPAYHTVESALKECNIKPEQVDYISYDHFHTQDARRWVGGDAPYFPNAQLLIPVQEWASAQGLLPCQAEWYCPNGVNNIPKDKVILLDKSVQLGDGIALIATPGHTEGNQSLVCRVLDGIRVTSENGVSADAYAPINSRINAVRKYAQNTGAEVILNGNTLESSVDHYLSMILEKTIAGPSIDPAFPNCAPSSEHTPYWLLPGDKPSRLVGETCFGVAQ